MVSRYLVLLFKEEVVVWIVMKLREDSLSDELVRHLPFHLHVQQQNQCRGSTKNAQGTTYLLDQLEHMVIGIALKHDLAHSEFEESDSCSPPAASCRTSVRLGDALKHTHACDTRVRLGCASIRIFTSL